MPTLPDYKRKALEALRAELIKDYEANVAQQGRTNSAVEQQRLKREADDLERKIAELDEQPMDGPLPEISPVFPEHPPRSKLFGRKDEVEQILQFLNKGDPKQVYSFVTICGISGIGKTVLASHIFESSNQSKWVSIEDIQDWDSCLTRIAEALFGKSKPIAAIIDFIKTEAVWLFLDGIDLLVEEPQLKGFLRRLAPDDKGKIIITSRSPLNLRTELTIPLRPLQSESATKLFIECWKPDNMNLSTTQQIDVRVICGDQYLNGHPFAIELIGQYARKRGPFNLRSIIADLKPEIQQGEAGVSMLEELVNKLLKFLSKEETRLLQRLALWPGNFGEDTVMLLAEIHPIINWGRPLDNLTNARLLNVSQQTDGSVSYQLHMVVKAIGKKLAQELPEFKALQRTIGSRLLQSNVLADWRAGLLSLFEAEEWGGILSAFRQKYGASFINDQFFAEANSELQLQTRACYALAYAFDQLGNVDLAMEYAELGERILKDVWEPTLIGYKSLLLRFGAIKGRNFLLKGKRENGKEVVRMAFNTIYELSDGQKAQLRWEIGQMYLLKGISHDDPKEAEDAYRKALAIYSEIQDIGQILKTQSNLGTALVEQGRIRESAGLNKEILNSLDMNSDLLSPFLPWTETLRASEYANIVDALTKLTEFEEAKIYADPGLVYCEERGWTRSYAALLINTGILEGELEDYRQARKRFLAALELSTDYGYSEYESEIHSCLADLNMKEGKLNDAQESLQYAFRSRDPYDQAIALRVAGTIHMTQKQYDLAKQKLLESKDISQKNGFAYFEARACLELGRLYRALNAQDDMEQELLEAEVYFLQIDVPYYLDEIVKLRASD